MARSILGGVNGLHAFITAQRALDQLPIHTRFNNDICQHLTIADVPTVNEIRSKQPLDDGILTIMLFGQPDEPVGIKRVRRSLDSVKCEVDTKAATTLPLTLRMSGPFWSLNPCGGKRSIDASASKVGSRRALRIFDQENSLSKPTTQHHPKNFRQPPNSQSWFLHPQRLLPQRQSSWMSGRLLAKAGL